MKTLIFEISITASKEKVWYALWDEPNYEYWTSAFCEGSRAVSSWLEGDKIHFLDPNNNGMASKIVKNVPFDCMIFEHITEIYEGKESPIDEKIKQWTGCQEQYFLTEENGITHLKVVTQTIDDYMDFFNNTMPNAIAKVKELAEQPDVKNITIRTSIDFPIEKVWDYFTQSQHIIHWNFATEDWHCPKSENILEVGKTFSTTMASKDGKHSFDFSGIYTEIIPLEKMAYTMDGDQRKVVVKFNQLDQQTIITEIFEPETENSLDIQRQGWQAILDNFKKYTSNN